MPTGLLSLQHIHEFAPLAFSSRMRRFAGERCGRLVVLRPMRRLADRRGTYWECRCSCGTCVIVNSINLHKTQSCGCFQRENMSRVKRITGLAGTPTYACWNAMRDRCSRPTHRQYKDYGGRGIAVDPRWSKFENFLADMGVMPEGMTIDRRDNNGNYTPENCRWATMLVQQNNKRNNRLVEYRGERMTVAQLARSHGLKHSQIYDRIVRGWSAERAVSAAIGVH